MSRDVSTAAVLYLLSAGAAGWLLAGPPVLARAVSRQSVGRRLPLRSLLRGRGRPRPGGLAAAALLGGPVGGLLVWSLAQTTSGGAVAMPLALTVAVAAAGLLWLVARARSHAVARLRRSEVVEGCEALASGLRAGLPPERVLARLAEDLPLLVPAAAAARLGGDVATALRGCATIPGCERLTMLASAWEVARRSGAGLAEVVSGIATRVRADAGRRRQVDAALGGARSTARLFAVLPLFGLALGAGMDADPIAVLVRSAAGAWCLCIGTTLAVLGLVWVERLADGATR